MKTYTVIVHEEEEEEEGGYWAEVEELPGCFASGDTLDELEEDIKAAIEQHLAALKELGQPLPPGQGSGVEGIRRWEIGVPA
ncbi:MAG: type II toxin-antitoxin system HicB family antitoxin [Dehalococcoidia bacterium]|nr:type II toxin-antitoxin system HicB family antitoxin [Dehalococcoidia bacterium]